MHPRRFKEAPPVVSIGQRLACFIDEHHILWRLREADHVVAKPRNLGGERRLILRGIHILGDVSARRPTLQLAAPDAAKVHVALTVRVLEDRGVDAVGALDRFGLCLERTGRLVGNCGANPEDVLLVLHGKIQVVLPALLGRVRRPHLPACPRHILDIERDAVIGDRTTDRVHREHMVVAHGEVAAEIIRRNAGVDVVRGVDVDLAVEDVGRRIGGVDLRDQWLGQELRRIQFLGGPALTTHQRRRRDNSNNHTRDSASAHDSAPRSSSPEGLRYIP